MDEKIVPTGDPRLKLPIRTLVEKVKPCTCRIFHIKCDPKACVQQPHASPEEFSLLFRELRENGEGGCRTCRVLYAALNVAQIRKAWVSSIHVAVESGRSEAHTIKTYREMSGDIENVAEGLVKLTFIGPKSTHDRIVVRTCASGSSQDWRHFNLNINASGKLLPCRPIPRLQSYPVTQTNSDITFDTLKHWLDICNKTHTCYVGGATLLPKRVLKISDKRVSLYVSNSGEAGRYATMSHRWGQQETFTLSERNLQNLCRGIAWSDLPKTAQDAIDVCRRLNIYYLWIDALCIMQTNIEDWNDQSVKMCDIYGSAYLNIAATESNDSEGGCFRSTAIDTHPPRHTVPTSQGEVGVTVQQQPHLTHGDYGSNYRASNDTPPLLQRAWVLQERLLAPRVVYYAQKEILWECREAARCQCGAINVISLFKAYYHECLSSGDPLPWGWMRVAEKYSSLNLSYDSDRAVALSGIAREAYDTGRGGQYIAGLWTQYLAHQLCWDILDTNRKPESYIAPSWSWLSVFGTINFDNRMDFYGTCSAVDVVITEAVIQAEEQNGTGRILAGHIKLDGRAVILQAEVESYRKGELANYRLWNEEKNIDFWFEPDYIMSIEKTASITEVTLLYMGHFWEDRSNFLVLVKVPTKERTEGHEQLYERLGIIWFSKDETEVQTILDATDSFRKMVII